ncbi:hypothetical protein [Nocardia brasiliensis]|uniref:hypothetical protein n=1 Tax=Nocardia brasiliensis TaxID=37326 RepID=UPI002455B710|nr:hypothetical protein [Nocardia brasiliensis]
MNATIADLTLTSVVLSELLRSTRKPDTVQDRGQSTDIERPVFARHSVAVESFSLREAAELLQRNGIDIGQHRLKARLHHLGWVDDRNVPAAAPLGALVLTSPARDGKAAVVRVTPEGLNRLRDALLR